MIYLTIAALVVGFLAYVTADTWVWFVVVLGSPFIGYAASRAALKRRGGPQHTERR